jgi:hypothetical protein
VQGDYNGDQVVDAQDYTFWRGDFGDNVASGTGADGNQNGVIDAADYVIWRNSLGSGSGSATIPEPRLLLATLLLGFIFRPSRSRSEDASF